MFVLVFEVTVVFVSPQFESAGGQEGGKKASSTVGRAF